MVLRQEEAWRIIIKEKRVFLELKEHKKEFREGQIV